MCENLNPHGSPYPWEEQAGGELVGVAKWEEWKKGCGENCGWDIK